VKTHKLAGVAEHDSQTWTENFGLGPHKFPNTGTCGIIKIRYELEVELDAKGPHSDLEMKVPITIGDVPYGGSLPQPPSGGIGLVPTQSEVPPVGFGFNPEPVGFAPTYPPNTGGPFGGGSQNNFGAPYSGGAGAPYAGAAVTPNPAGAGTYPGAGAVPYSGATPSPYPGAAPTPYPGTAGTPYPGAVPAPYPGATGAPYAGATGAPQLEDASAPYPEDTPQPYPGVSYPSATSTPNTSAPYAQPAYAPLPQTQNHIYPDAFPTSEAQPRTIPYGAAETNPLLENK